MKYIFLILLFVAPHLAKKPTKKGINIALETAFIFDPKDANYDLNLIRALRSYLDQLQEVIMKKNNLRTKDKTHYTLSEFLYDLGNYLIGYSNEDFKRFAVSLHSNVEDYYPEGTVFHKIIYDPRMKAYIKHSLKDWTVRDPVELKNDLKELYNNSRHNLVFLRFVLALDGLFSKEDCREFAGYVKKFSKLPKTQKKLDKLMEKVLNFAVFNRYKMLNPHQKSLLIDELSRLTTYVASAFRDKIKDTDVFKYKRTHENETAPQAVTSKPELKETYKREFSGSDREDVVVDPNDSLEKITRNSKEHDNKTDHKIQNQHEIVLDKVVEINVRAADMTQNVTSTTLKWIHLYGDNNINSTHPKTDTTKSGNSAHNEIAANLPTVHG